MGDPISLDDKGELCLYSGRVVDLQGQPIVGAFVDVWSDNDEGFYDVQQSNIQPPMNNRGIFRTGEDGRYSFRGIKPVSYPIPDDGPVGKMLAGLGRHPYRPAHMHFLVGAPGYDKVTTHIFVTGDPYILVVGDDVTTDHISPASAVLLGTETARYLVERGEDPKDLNVYASRRGNWEAMLRGLFAAKTVRNLLGSGIAPGSTIHAGSGDEMPLWRAAARFEEEAPAW